MKKFIFAVILLLTVQVCEAKVYVALDKQTGETLGTVDIREDTIGDWSQRYIMKEANESYRGLSGYEIKYQSQTLRKATQKEIDDYKKALDEKIAQAEKDDALKTLGLTSSDIEKIKKLP